MLALASRRLHDRGKSAWWLVPFQVVPWLLMLAGSRQLAGVYGGLVLMADFALALWGFVEIGLLEGTRGPNRYGPDPQGV